MEHGPEGPTPDEVGGIPGSDRGGGGDGGAAGGGFPERALDELVQDHKGGESRAAGQAFHLPLEQQGSATHYLPLLQAVLWWTEETG